MSVRNRLVEVRELLAHFARRERAFFIPMVLVLVLGALLLGASAGIGHVAPFVYSLF